VLLAVDADDLQQAFVGTIVPPKVSTPSEVIVW
jgi:hypothetical protein